MSFRDSVINEANKQKELRQQGKAIPAEYKKYARISGLVAFLVAGVGSIVILVIGFMNDTYYIAFILLFATLSVMGLVQLITGRNILRR